MHAQLGDAGGIHPSKANLETQKDITEDYMQHYGHDNYT
jgi:hypothetical protein